jgi:hypothetical protein
MTALLMPVSSYAQTGRITPKYLKQGAQSETGSTKKKKFFYYKEQKKPQTIEYSNGDKLFFRGSDKDYMPENNIYCHYNHLILHKANGVVIRGFYDGTLENIRTKCPAFTVEKIENLNISGKTNEEISTEIGELLASLNPLPDVGINRGTKEMTQRGFYSLIPGTSNRIYRNDAESLIEYSKDISSVIWKQRIISIYNPDNYDRYIFRADGKTIALRMINVDYEAFCKELKLSKYDYEKMPTFCTYFMTDGGRWSRKGTEFVYGRGPMSIAKVKVGDIAYEKMDVAFRNKAKAAVTRYATVAAAGIKKEWNPQSTGQKAKIVACTPNTLIVDGIYYDRDVEFMKKVGNNLNDLNLLFSKYIELYKEEWEDFCNHAEFTNYSLYGENLDKLNYLKTLYTDKSIEKVWAQYAASIAGKNKGESDNEYISRLIKWPSSMISNGVLNISVEVELLIDRNGNAKVFSLSFNEGVDDVFAEEVKRVMESIKWNPSMVGTTKVITRSSWNFKLSYSF